MTTSDAITAENQVLREALEQIANPIDALRKKAKAEGKVLDGMMAVRLTESPQYLMGIARDASGKTMTARWLRERRGGKRSG